MIRGLICPAFVENSSFYDFDGEFCYKNFVVEHVKIVPLMNIMAAEVGFDIVRSSWLAKILSWQKSQYRIFPIILRTPKTRLILHIMRRIPMLWTFTEVDLFNF